MKQLFVVVALLVCGISSGVEVDDFFSKIAGIQEEAIAHASDLAVEGRYELHKRLIEERNFPGRNAVILALLKLNDRLQSDLVGRLLLDEVPFETSSAVVAALRKTMNIARFIAVLPKKITDGELSEARTAARSLALIARAKPQSDAAVRLYDAISKVSDSKARSIFQDMFHWEIVPNLYLLQSVLESFSSADHDEETRADAAMLRIMHYENHEGAANILKATVQKTGSRGAHGVAKAVVAAKKLSAEDRDLILTLQNHKDNLTMMSAALAWREIRQERVDPSFNIDGVQWMRTFSLFDDFDMDEESAEALLADLAAYLHDRKDLWGALGSADVSAQISGTRGGVMLIRLQTILTEQICSANVVSNLETPLPQKFLQAILL